MLCGRQPQLGLLTALPRTMLVLDLWGSGPLTYLEKSYAGFFCKPFQTLHGPERESHLFSTDYIILEDPQLFQVTMATQL